MTSKLILLLVWMLCCGYAWSTETNDFTQLHIRGFGTLGAARSSSPDAEFILDLSQPKGIKGGEWSGRIDNVLGLQVNWSATPELEIVGQVVSRYRYDRSRSPELVWAFAKWEPSDQLSLRAGRIGADLMMLADSRLVGYSHLTVRPSADFFGPLFFSYFEGVDGSLTLPLGKGLIRSKLFAGEIHEKVSGAPGIWDTSGSSVYGLVIDYFTGHWQFRASSTSARYSNDINFTSLTDALHTAAEITGITNASSAADVLETDGTISRYYSLGTVYDKGPLQVQAALNKITHETATFQNSHAGYFLAGYRINKITPYVGVSWWKSKYKNCTTGLPDIEPFTALNDAYQNIMVASGTDQITYTLGARWDAFTNTSLKLQWDAVRGEKRSKFAFVHPNQDWNGKTDIVSVTMDFIF